MSSENLELVEALAWAVYLDLRTPAVFEEWKRLWAMRNVTVPAGAWEVP